MCRERLALRAPFSAIDINLPPPGVPVGVSRLIVAGCMGWGVVADTGIIAAAGGELSRRERNPAEHFTRILSATPGRIAAFLSGNGVIQHRND